MGRIAGIPIVLAYSWFLIAAVTVFLFGPQLAQGYPGLGAGAYGVAFIYALLLLFSVLVHELAHALMAKVYHWPTQKIVLNLWGGHTQFENFTATPGRSLLVAFAGPVANIALAGLGWLLLNNLAVPQTLQAAVLSTLVNIFVWANLLIGAFNVLPGLPLDGGRLVESIVWKATGSQEKGTVAAGWAGRIIVVLLVLAVVGLPLLNGGQPSSTNILVTVFIAGFLWLGATAAISNARMRLRLPEISAGRLSDRAVGMPDGSSVAQVLAVGGSNPGLSIVLCTPDGRPSAIVDQNVLASVPGAVAVNTPATAVARNLAAGAYVPQSASGQELVQYLAQLAGSEYAVIDQRGQVTGVLSQAVVVAAITGKPDPRLSS
ncbi:site-2 protease family protein [Paenarthrobacter sp. PH39-S1]|uniref:site-2 protease family protein n=1 Tax=Paenarthrobacter sp. PH39-S1 TaxID=3046204 RepID=UPI0024B95E81|nr:site-2 protease family protein [Paenarthrobacter sp. PH39-S1]MDJ0356766.1 site-2 protease family protein [Paenarthrobacter sp. PH39-S1]